jgi:hypothetical protein
LMREPQRLQMSNHIYRDGGSEVTAGNQNRSIKCRYFGDMIEGSENEFIELIIVNSGKMSVRTRQPGKFSDRGLYHRSAKRQRTTAKISYRIGVNWYINLCANYISKLRYSFKYVCLYVSAIARLHGRRFLHTCMSRAFSPSHRPIKHPLSTVKKTKIL